MTEFQVWSIEVKIPKCILDFNAVRIKGILDRMREDLAELNNPLAKGVMKNRKPSKIHVRTTLVKS